MIIVWADTWLNNKGAPMTGGALQAVRRADSGAKLQVLFFNT
jgi:hypothetical protein